MLRLFKIFVPTGIVMLLLTELLLISGCFMLAAWTVSPVDPVTYLVYENGLVRLALVVICMLLAMHFQDLYSDFSMRSRSDLVQRLSTALGLTLIMEGAISYFGRELRAPARVMLVGSACTMVVLFSWRVLFGKLWRFAVQRVLFVGNSSLFDEIFEMVKLRPELGVHVLGCVREERLEDPDQGAKVLGPLDRMAEIARATKPDRIVVGMRERRDFMPIAELLKLRFAGFVVEEVASFFEKTGGRVSCQDLRPSQLVFSNELGPREWWFRPLFTFAVAFCGLLCALPWMILIVAAIRLTSRGPALYRQTRVGQNGRLFSLYKFRSMYADAEEKTGAVWSTGNDPRITPLGRILRNFRLDELPQLLNVLRGDMALVGPRPERPEFVEILARKIPYYLHRHCIKPGITGWAQINYKYGETFEDAVRKLEYDLYYIKYMSQSLDNYIIFATIKTMLLTRGAQ